MLKNQRISSAILVLALASLAAVASDAGAVDPPDSDGSVLVTITMGRLEGAKKEPVDSYQLLAVSGGESSRLMFGDRVPIPVTTFEADAQPIVPVTSYSYQNVGFSADVRAWLREDGKVKLYADVEASRVATATSDAAQPTIETAHHRVRALLDSGIPLQMVRRDHAGSATGYLEIEARVLE